MAKNGLLRIGNGGERSGASRVDCSLWRKAAGFLRANAIRIAAQTALLGGVIAALAASGCGRSIFPVATSSPTPTPSPSSTGTFAYVTDYNDGVVSEFRIGSSGALTFLATAKAGAAQGPAGLAVSPSNKFLYVANSSDGRVYQFRIDSTDGALTPIGAGSVSDGAGSAPQQIAIDPSGSFAYVTNLGNGSISEYSINSSTGALSSIGTATGLGAPLGVVANPNGGFIYVTNRGSGADTGTVMSFPASGVLGSPVSVGSLGSVTGTPGLPAIGPAGLFLYVPDIKSNVVAEFAVSGATLTFVNPTISAGLQPFHMVLDPSGTFAYTANQTGNTISSFGVSAGTLVPVGTATGLNMPTGLAVSPNSQFLYTTNQGNGTITQFSIDSVSGTLNAVATFNSESPAHANSAPQFIAIAQ